MTKLEIKCGCEVMSEYERSIHICNGEDLWINLDSLEKQFVRIIRRLERESLEGTSSYEELCLKHLREDCNRCDVFDSIRRRDMPDVASFLKFYLREQFSKVKKKK